MTSAAECRKLALDGDRHWPKRRLRTLWRRRRSLAVAALLHLWRGPLANSPRTTMPNSFAQACWAVLFISNNTEEPTEHTQMRFELASATLAERIQLGIVAVHEAPEAAAEFLTMDTPQIGAADDHAVSVGCDSRSARAARAQSCSPIENVPLACQTMRDGRRVSSCSSHAVRAERAHPRLALCVCAPRQVSASSSGWIRPHSGRGS